MLFFKGTVTNFNQENAINIIKIQNFFPVIENNSLTTYS